MALRRFLIFGLVLVIAAIVGSLEVFPSYTYAFQSSPAIIFKSSLNATSVVQNQTIRISLTDTNLLPFPNEPSDPGIFEAKNLSSPPCAFNFPYGLAAYQGRYTRANISSAKVIEIFDVFSLYFCGAISSGYVFRLGPLQTKTQYVDLNGYWTNGSTQHPGGGISQGILHSFLPGVYTLLVADAWGHTAFHYFVVT